MPTPSGQLLGSERARIWLVLLGSGVRLKSVWALRKTAPCCCSCSLWGPEHWAYTTLRRVRSEFCLLRQLLGKTIANRSAGQASAFVDLMLTTCLTARLWMFFNMDWDIAAKQAFQGTHLLAFTADVYQSVLSFCILNHALMAGRVHNSAFPRATQEEGKLPALFAAQERSRATQA